jgi:hypothetical protein
MASKLKRTIYTHSGVRVSPTINQAANMHELWWTNRFWQSGSINTPAGGGVTTAIKNAQEGYVQPRTVQNATFTLNIPRADVNVFGVLGVVDRPQLEAETATLEFSFIPEKLTGGSFVGAWTQKVFQSGDINALILDAVAQEPYYVDVWADGVGRIKTALMNSMSSEATIGALPTMTMGFTGRTHNYSNLDAASVDEDGNINPAAAGVGFDDIIAAPYEGPARPTKAGCFAEFDAMGNPLCPVNAAGFQVDLVEPQDINLAYDSYWNGTPLALDGAQSDPPTGPTDPGHVTNRDLINEPPEHQSSPGVYQWQDTNDAVGESIQNPDDDKTIQTGCAQSASLAWDLPVETLLCLGANPQHDGHTLGNPPGTSSFTVEALSLQLEQNTNAQNYLLVLGAYMFNLTNGAIDSRTHNLAVGDLFGSYNYVIGGSADGFSVS